MIQADNYFSSRPTTYMATIHRHYKRTDRQTDRHTASFVLRASRGKN